MASILSSFSTSSMDSVLFSFSKCSMASVLSSFSTSSMVFISSCFSTCSIVSIMSSFSTSSMASTLSSSSTSSMAPMLSSSSSFLMASVLSTVSLKSLKILLSFNSKCSSVSTSSVASTETVSLGTPSRSLSNCNATSFSLFPMTSDSSCITSSLIAHNSFTFPSIFGPFVALILPGLLDFTTVYLPTSDWPFSSPSFFPRTLSSVLPPSVS
ncbi:LOW QUALITY PROTEIN: hypothetical protein TorRG33x02_113730 [Trema orientale]|uniref:Uncharacterized protein n=1 Tax=Trema orientale TaxID=63057 RepID=A0A2P5F4Q9_TREOI|nr:LOW QUALITY PROTEIN: hypothetical protein TorRG33x02_113730 [Trema orientale]